MSPADIEQKLVRSARGGYCFEQNTLLMCVLNDLGYLATPLLCRVRYNKLAGVKTPFTHSAMRVQLANNPDFDYLVDVGFAGNGSMAPLLFHSEGAQDVPFGQSRITRQPTEPQYRLVQWKDTRGKWMDMYEFPDAGPPVEWLDLEVSNWWSCTQPTARFAASFFCYRLVGEEKHHIMNESYVIRRVDGSSEKRTIVGEVDLRTLLISVFGLEIPANAEGLGRYLA
jgi:N-hydroxyarylamine O-acetyltransferase